MRQCLQLSTTIYHYTYTVISRTGLSFSDGYEAKTDIMVLVIFSNAIALVFFQKMKKSGNAPKFTWTGVSLHAQPFPDWGCYFKQATMQKRRFLFSTFFPNL